MKKRTIVFLMIAMVAVNICALDNQSVSTLFTQLKQYQVPISNENSFTVWYDSLNADVLRGTTKSGGDDQVLRFRSTSRKEVLYLVYSGSIAGLPGWAIRDSSGNELYFCNSYKIVIPGNDLLYVEKTNYFNPPVMTEAVIGKDGIREIKQVLYSVNRKDIARNGFLLYAERTTSSEIVANIGVGAEVLVLGFTTENYDELKAERWILAMSAMGLVGWTPAIYIDKWYGNHQPSILKLFDNDTP